MTIYFVFTNISLIFKILLFTKVDILEKEEYFDTENIEIIDEHVSSEIMKVEFSEVLYEINVCINYYYIVIINMFRLKQKLQLSSEN